MIWVIGGTKDSREFLEKFASDDKDIIVTTATEYGGKLLEGLPVKVVCRKLTKDEMESFALFHNARVLGKKAACLLTISDSMVTGEKTSAKERQEAFGNMMEVALKAAAMMED